MLTLPELENVVALRHQAESKCVGRRQATNVHSRKRLKLKDDRLNITVLQTEGCADG